LDLTIVHADVQEMARNLANGAARRQAEIFGRLVQRLAAAGTEIATVTSMGGRFCIRELAAISPLPLLNAVPAVDAAIRARNLKTVGILGTCTVTESGLYGGITSARIVTPRGTALDQVHEAYVSMATAGHVTETQRDIFLSTGEYLCEACGAQGIILGGTDPFLAFAGQECGFLVVDCALAPIEGAVSAGHCEHLHRLSIKVFSRRIGVARALRDNRARFARTTG